MNVDATGPAVRATVPVTLASTEAGTVPLVRLRRAVRSTAVATMLIYRQATGWLAVLIGGMVPACPEINREAVRYCAPRVEELED